jgi:uncharacterized integral membrane protein
MKLIAWIVLLPATVVVIAFAVANRQQVAVSLDPLPFGFEAPLYVLALAFVFLGMLVGGASAWVKALRWRRRVAEARRELVRLEGELSAERTRSKHVAASAASTPPAIEHAA